MSASVLPGQSLHRDTPVRAGTRAWLGHMAFNPRGLEDPPTCEYEIAGHPMMLKDPFGSIQWIFCPRSGKFLWAQNGTLFCPQSGFTRNCDGECHSVANSGSLARHHLDDRLRLTCTDMQTTCISSTRQAQTRRQELPSFEPAAKLLTEVRRRQGVMRYI